MKKNIKVLLIALVVFLVGIGVHAKENVYYVNENGVELSQYEYVFLQNFYFDSFPEHITQEQYNMLVSNDAFNGVVERVTYEEPAFSSSNNGSRSDVYGTYAKTLTITKSCSTTCTVNLQAYWNHDPVVRSYDDIGFYFVGSSMISHNYTISASTTYYQTFSNIKTGTNGWGNTVKLAPTGTDVVVTTTATMNTGGKVYGSYQHATVDTNLTVAKNYTFSLGGYGHVFAFGTSATSVYDGMGGVDITL